MLPAQRFWRETILLLDVMWPRKPNESACCWEEISSYITNPDTEGEYTQVGHPLFNVQGPVVRKVDKFIRWINLYG